MPAGARVINTVMTVRVDYLGHEVAAGDDAPRPHFLLHRYVPYGVDRPGKIVAHIPGVDKVIDEPGELGMPRAVVPGLKQMLEYAGDERVEHEAAGNGDNDPFSGHTFKQGRESFRANAGFPRDSGSAFRIHEREVPADARLVRRKQVGHDCKQVLAHRRSHDTDRAEHPGQFDVFRMSVVCG